MNRCALPRSPDRRVSPDSAWPLRRADGTRFCDPQADAPSRKTQRKRRPRHV